MKELVDRTHKELKDLEERLELAANKVQAIETIGLELEKADSIAKKGDGTEKGALRGKDKYDGKNSRNSKQREWFMSKHNRQRTSD